MAQIAFPKFPLKKYYSYLPDGHIYKITNLKPTTVADGGGYWYCYFECEPFHKTDDGKTHLLYEGVIEENETKYVPVQKRPYNTGNKYYYTIDGENYIEHNGAYYSRNGKQSYSFPNSALELPQVTYQAKDDVLSYTYYFDKLIKCGDLYNVSNGQFKPMDVDPTGQETTFGSILLDMVKNHININAFTLGVGEIPEYLTGPNLSIEYRIESIGYYVPANYLSVYGVLFLEKLNNAMVDFGIALSEKYKVEGMTPYDILSFDSSVSDEPIGTITTTPSSSLYHKYTVVKYSDGRVENYELSGEISASSPGPMNIFDGAVSIEIGTDVNGIGSYAFSNCTELENINLHDGILTVGSYSFRGCSKLKTIVIPDAVTAIGASAFENCTDLTSVTLPYSLTEIGNTAFNKCQNLSSIEFGNKLTSIGRQAFGGCSSLTSVIIPKNVTTINTSAFSGCTNLVIVSISENLESITNNMFSGCTSLTSVTIPNSAKSIGNKAFNGCTSLNSVYITGLTSAISTDAFSNVSSTGKLYYKPNGISPKRELLDLFIGWTLYVYDNKTGKYVEQGIIIPEHGGYDYDY